MGKLPPAQFAREDADGTWSLGDVFATQPFMERRPNSANVDLAKMQMGRQPRRAPEIGAISTVCVVGQRFVEKADEEFVRSTLTGAPPQLQALGPVNCRFQPQLGKFECRRPAARYFQVSRFDLFWLRRRLWEAGLPEWRENLVGLALLGVNRPRLKEQRTIEALGSPAAFLQEGFHPGIPLDRCGFITAIPEHGT